MAKYRITNDKTGQAMIVSGGDTPPSKSQIAQLFASRPQTKPKPVDQPVDQELTGRISSIESALANGSSSDFRGGMRGAMEEKLGNLKHLQSLQEKGVDTTSQLPAGSTSMGFGVDPVKSLTKALSDKFKKPVKVFREGEDTFYKDPNTGVTTLVNPNIAGAIGHSLPVAGDVVGTIGGGVAGGILTKNPAGILGGETIGSTVGTTATEFARLAIGSMLGVHDLSVGQMAAKAGVEGAKAGAITLGTGGVLIGSKSAVNFIQNRVFTKEAALESGMTSKQADAAINEVNKINKNNGGSLEVEGTTGLRSDSVTIQAAEKEVRNTNKHAQEFVDRDIADQAAQTQTLKGITHPEKGGLGGEAVQDVVENQVKTRMSQARTIKDANVTQLESQLARLNEVNKEAVGKPTREILLEKVVTADTANKQIWQDVKQFGGYNEAQQVYGIPIIEGKGTKKLRFILDRKSRTATSEVARKSAAGLFAKKPSSKSTVDEKVLPRGSIKFRSPAQNRETPDLDDFNSDLSALRTSIREKRNGVNFGNTTLKEMEDLKHAMVADRSIALQKSGKGALLAKIEKAEIDTLNFRQAFDRSIIGDLTKVDSQGGFKIKEKDFVDELMKADQSQVDIFTSVIADKPTLQFQWKQGLANKYQREVIDKISPFTTKVLTPIERAKVNKISTDWLELNKETLSKFFSEKELASIAKTGNMATLVKKQMGQYQRILDNSAKFGRGKLKSLDPHNLVKFVTNDAGKWKTPAGKERASSLAKVDYVKNVTKNYPAAWSKFTDDYSKAIHDDVLTSKGIVDPKRLDKWVSGEKDMIVKIKGQKYYDDLASVNEVSKILSKKLHSLSGDEQRRVIVQALRGGVAPPLTRRGRAFTAMILFNSKRVHEEMAKSFLDPARLGKMAELGRHKSVTRRSVELAASLGLIEDYPQELF